jgi:hypothetical protein
MDICCALCNGLLLQVSDELDKDEQHEEIASLPEYNLNWGWGNVDGENEGYFCQECIEPLATNYAELNCKVTAPLHEYDEECYSPITPDEYEECKECYTQNAVHAHNRHQCTNYDEICEGLDRRSFVDDIFYRAVRNKIDDLIGDCNMFY